MLFVIFWILFIIIAIEDAMYFEVCITRILLFMILFAIIFSFKICILSAFIFIFFKNNRLIGEIDLLLIPIGWFLTNYAIGFWNLIVLFGVLFSNIKHKKTPMVFPILLSVLTIKAYG
jgi:hypothetical protein